MIIVFNSNNNNNNNNNIYNCRNNYSNNNNNNNLVLSSRTDAVPPAARTPRAVRAMASGPTRQLYHNALPRRGPTHTPLYRQLLRVHQRVSLGC